MTLTFATLPLLTLWTLTRGTPAPCDAGRVRYQSRLEIVVDGENVPVLRYWHRDSYEKRNGSWQVVWSQATLIQRAIRSRRFSPARS